MREMALIMIKGQKPMRFTNQGTRNVKYIKTSMSVREGPLFG